MAYSPYVIDLNSLGSLPIVQPGVSTEVYERFTPVAPSVIDQRWPTPSEQFQQLPTFNQRWPTLYEQMPNMDYPLFEGPGETFPSVLGLEYASLSGPRSNETYETFTSPFAVSQQPLPYPSADSHLLGMTGPYGGTDPRFFGGGVNMTGWNEPQLTPWEVVQHRSPTPWEEQNFFQPMSTMDYRWNLPQALPQTRIDQGFDALGMNGPTYDQWTMTPGSGGFVDRLSQSPQTALFSNYDPTPSVYDNSWLWSSGMTSSPSSYNLYTSGATPDWARIAPGPTPLYTGPTPQPYGGVGPMYGAPGGFFTTPLLGY